MKQRQIKFSVNFNPEGMTNPDTYTQTATIAIHAEDFEQARNAFLTLYPQMVGTNYAIDYWWEREKYGI